jgi:N-acetylglutamate synthase-like GNAT family acetyltransferase
MKTLFDNYFISNDKTLLDLDLIHDFLSNRSYWAKGISRERVEKALQNALCFGVFEGKNQVGYARVITDFATFGYVADVFILENHRGKGLSKALMQTITEHPELKNLRRLLLATADAHGLYAQYGFNLLEKPERWMEKSQMDIYLKENINNDYTKQ